MGLQVKERPYDVKSYSFKAILEQNTIKGGPAVIGNLDQGNDVIFPGAFNGVLDDFLKDGFVAFGHDWDELPIAMPIVAKEQGSILYSEALFHSTQTAQDNRTVAKERLDNGLTVGLSIGYSCAPDGTHIFENGQDMLDWVKGAGLESPLLDTKSIAACDCWCRAITQFEKLYEWSIVPVPMNRAAGAMDVKSWIPTKTDDEEKMANGSTSMPLAGRDMTWDQGAADKRVRTWADATDAPNEKYRKAFFWYDAANADKLGSYKLQFADIVDGKMMAVPHAIFACMGGRGVDAADIPDADKTAIKKKIATYYKRMADEFNDPTIVMPRMGKALPATERDFEAFLREAGFSKSQAVACTNHGFKALLRDAEGDDAGTKQDDPIIDVDKVGETPAIEPEVKTASPDPIIVNVPLTPLEEEYLRRKQNVARVLNQRRLSLDASIARSLNRVAGAN